MLYIKIFLYGVKLIEYVCSFDVHVNVHILVLYYIHGDQSLEMHLNARCELKGMKLPSCDWIIKDGC